MVEDQQHPRRFPAVPPVPDFRALEEQALEHWEAHDVFSRSISERRRRPEYVFFEGPPTANGRPGLHHVWARVYKDLICRYRTMTGRRVPRRAGWDTHGLAVEVEVEKALGLSGKDQIEEYGVDRFVERCRQSVYEYVDDWKALTRRIGYWVDLDARLLDPGPRLHRLGLVAPVATLGGGRPLRGRQGRPLLPALRHVAVEPRAGPARRLPGRRGPVRVRAAARSWAIGPEGADALVVWTTTPWTLVANTARGGPARPRPTWSSTAW